MQYTCGGGIEKLPFAVEEIGLERLLHLVHRLQLLNNLKERKKKLASKLYNQPMHGPSFAASFLRPHLLDALLVLGRGLGATFQWRDGVEELLLEPHRLLSVLLPLIPCEERRQEGEGRYACSPPAAATRGRGEREAWHSPALAAPRRRGKLGGGGGDDGAGAGGQRPRRSGRARDGERERGGRHGTAQHGTAARGSGGSTSGIFACDCGGSRGARPCVISRRRQGRARRVF